MIDHVYFDGIIEIDFALCKERATTSNTRTEETVVILEERCSINFLWKSEYTERADNELM